MTRYETSPEVRPLEKTICEFAGLNGYDPMNVFTDFLRYVIHGFSPGAPPLKDWRYKRQQNAAFMKMFAEWVRLMQKQLEAASWYDALGDLFMALSSRKGQQAQGQFFTPVHICDLIGNVYGNGRKKDRAEDKRPYLRKWASPAGISCTPPG